ncbi:unnamed protein product, partial [Vitis vinifera]
MILPSEADSESSKRIGWKQY